MCLLCIYTEAPVAVKREKPYIRFDGLLPLHSDKLLIYEAPVVLLTVL